MNIAAGDHDPGGRVRMKLPNYIRTSAVFAGSRKEHRLALWRWHAGCQDGLFVLWVMMNPSMADETCDDPTLGRVRFFSEREGFKRWAVCNVMSYRLTNSAQLRTLRGLSHPENQDTIMRMAQSPRCGRIVLAYGAPLMAQEYAALIVAKLRTLHQPLWCLGVGSKGAPKHPLYISGSVPMEVWHGDGHR